MTLAEAIRARRTVHNFQSKDVPESIVLSALDAARWAPNHRLTEPWRFILLGRETAAAVTERNAQMLLETKGQAAADHKRKRWSTIPGWMVLTCQRSEDDLRQQEDYAACACAAQNFMLTLAAEGVATKWSTGPVTRDYEFYQLVGADPDEEMVVGLFWFGYAEETPESQRTELGELLVSLP